MILIYFQRTVPAVKKEMKVSNLCLEMWHVITCLSRNYSPVSRFKMQHATVHNYLLILSLLRIKLFLPFSSRSVTVSPSDILVTTYQTNPAVHTFLTSTLNLSIQCKLCTYFILPVCIAFRLTAYNEGQCGA
jgi:hypothetical protein